MCAQSGLYRAPAMTAALLHTQCNVNICVFMDLWRPHAAQTCTRTHTNKRKRTSTSAHARTCAHTIYAHALALALTRTSDYYIPTAAHARASFSDSSTRRSQRGPGRSIGEVLLSSLPVSKLHVRTRKFSAVMIMFRAACMRRDIVRVKPEFGRGPIALVVVTYFVGYNLKHRTILEFMLLK